MADAEEDSSNGWHEVEQTLTALELPPVPPTSDPQRLLGYVLHILPRYTEMEMLATHLRLYASTLEQDMEQVKSHVRLLTREASGEREKKQFLERYAAQVVKERNDLLHSRGSSKKKATGSSHFVWHTCCKKNSSHAMDLAPSILAFRGEKLQEAAKQIETLQGEVHNQELLRKELDFLLKKTQREHDSKTAADRKHIQQLEKQIMQRSTLHSSLERKLYEVESVLAKHEKNKGDELSVVSNRVREAHARIEALEKENSSLVEEVASLSRHRDRLVEMLEETTQSKDIFARQIDELSEKCNSLESEVEALQSEVDLLQTKDINDIRSQYTARIDRLQQDHTAVEKKLRQEIDRVKLELKKQSEFLTQTTNVHQSQARMTTGRSPSRRANGFGGISLSIGESGWSDGIFDDDRQIPIESIGSSLSRSQLSDSYNSLSLARSSGCSHFKLSDEVGMERAAVSTKSNGGYLPVQDELVRSKQQSGSSQRSAHTNHAAPFDWEIFIDSASEISIPSLSRRSSSAIQRSLNFSSSTIPHENSLVRSKFDSPDGDSEDSFNGDEDSEKHDDKHDHEDGNSVLSSPSVVHSASSNDRSLGELAEDEEEKENDKDSPAESDKGSVQDNVNNGSTEQGPADNDLARDLYQMLNGLEQKRKEEEQKASQAEQALLQFQQLQQGVQNMQLSSDS